MSILLLNPRSARWNYRAPLSLLALGSVLEGRYKYLIIDENYEQHVERRLVEEIKSGGVRYLGITAMPGPQLVRAVTISRSLKASFPYLNIVWGGTFPTIHTDTVLRSDYVDFVVRGQGELTFLELVDVLERGGALESVRGLSYRKNGSIIHNPQRELVHPDSLPPLPFHRIHFTQYLQRTYLGNRTTGFHSSIGCPFYCGFCSVVAMFNGRWLAKSAESVANEIIELQTMYGVDSVEFFDDNFFTSEKRAAEFAERIRGCGINWWGEGRSDTLLNYSDRTLKLMQESGCKMIYTGAESGSQEVLNLMNKGGTQTPDRVLEFARRIREFGIVPEFSFVFGSPGENLDESIERDIRFIRKIKAINPASEIIFYIYAPVLLPGAQLFEQAKKNGFKYPEYLEEWVSPSWQIFDLRKNPATPWLKGHQIRRIRNFERVLNACYPTLTDLKITETQKRFLRWIARWRYDSGIYFAPYEIRLVLSKILKYRQPEIEGAAQYRS